jgi:DNA mismatch repair protein MutL
MTTPRPIKALPDVLINQIAAGEVVERPASIAKELIENALDAGARTLRIEIRDGGIALLSIADDGHGIPRDELLLALTRHCTSKISSAEDLEAIRTLGFRGEALASIAAVAQLSLASRRTDADHGWRVESLPGQRIGLPEPAPRGPGTTVTVRGLFATLPARRQFLRRPVTETLVIQQLIRGLAFCQPDVAFHLSFDDKRHWQAPAAHDEHSAAQRWRAVFGAEFAREARFVDVRAAGMRVFGWVGPAPLAKAQSELQLLAVNGRLVRDRQVAHGVRLAFGDSIPAGRHPCYALHLELDPADVDVNVHPGKTEVRFKRLREAHDLVFSVVRQALEEIPGKSESRSEPGAVLDTPDAMPVTGAWGVAEPAPSRAPRAPFANQPRPAMPSTGVALESPADDRWILLGQRFLVNSSAEGLQIFDLAGLLREMLAAGAPAVGERLTFPVQVPAPPGATLSLILAELNDCGCEFTQIAPQHWALRRLPAGLPPTDAERVVAALLAEPDFPHAPRVALIRALVRGLDIPSHGVPTAWLEAWIARRPDLDFAAHRRRLGLNDLAEFFDRSRS